MRLKKCYKVLVLFLMVFAISLSTVKLVGAQSSILNTDDSLGIFRDLTSDEIVDYYSDLETGMSGDTLLDNLQDILKDGQRKLKYSSGDTTSTSWNGYYLLDRDWALSPLSEAEISSQTYAKTGIFMNILYATNSIYVNTKINDSDGCEYSFYDLTTNEYKTTGTGQFDREHVLPKSFGFNGANNRFQELTAGCDMQNLHAGEHNGNSTGHNNYPYGTVVKHDSSTQVTSGITGEVIGYKGNNSNNITVFEPLDIDKGDIARTVFYMCARYHNYEELGSGDNTPAITLSNAATSTTTMEPEDTETTPAAYGELDDLLAWNDLDPVDEFEIHRNNLCYNAIQYNRNPFIDYPEWADIAFTEDSEFGIDLSKEDGIESSIPLTTESLTINGTINDIYKGETFDFTKLTFTYTLNGVESSVALSDLAYQVKYSNEVLTVDNLSSYSFSNLGEYEIIFTYGDTTAKMKVKAISKYDIKTDVVDKVTLEKDKSLDLSSIVVTLMNKGEGSTVSSGYSVKIVDSNGEAVSDDINYKFDKMGSYTVTILYEVDGETLETTFEVNVTLPKLYIIVGAALIVLVLLVIIVVYCKLSKKDKKKVKSLAKKAVNRRRK